MQNFDITESGLSMSALLMESTKQKQWWCWWWWWWWWWCSSAELDIYTIRKDAS
jgi:hypothetical protein